jgi:tetratricopeptide (TPR) repeat protein
VVRGQSTGKEWEDKLIDLRVEDNENAVAEIERLLKVFRAYEHMNAGDLAIEKGDEEKALHEYQSANNMFPENLEMKYWFAVSLVNIGKIQDALPKFKYIFERDKNWVELTKRIVENGLLKVDEPTLDLIINIR